MLDRLSSSLLFLVLSVGTAFAQDTPFPTCNPTDYEAEAALAADANSAYQLLLSLGATPDVARRQVASMLVTSGCSPEVLTIDPATSTDACHAAQSLNMYPGCTRFVTDAETIASDPSAEEWLCRERIRTGGNSDRAAGIFDTPQDKANVSLDKAQTALDLSKNQSDPEKARSIDTAKSEIDNAALNNPALDEVVQDDYNGVTDDQGRIDLLRVLNNPDESGLTEDEKVAICVQSEDFELQQNQNRTLARICISGIPFDTEQVQDMAGFPIARRCDTERAGESITWLTTELSDPNSLIGLTYIDGLQDAERRRAFARDNAQVPHCFGEVQPVWNDDILPSGGYECVAPDTVDRDTAVVGILAGTMFEGCPPEQLYDCMQERSKKIDSPELVSDPATMAVLFGQYVAELEARRRSQCLLIGAFDPGLGRFVRDESRC